MSKLYTYKFIPQNYLVEETLLGIIMIYPSSIYSLQYTIKKEYFFLEKNQIIYLNLTKTAKSDSNSLVEVFYNLRSDKALDYIGGINKIIGLMKQGQIFICSNGIKNHIEQLILLLGYYYFKRLVIQMGHNIIKIGHIENISSQKIYNKTVNYINSIEQQITEKNKSTIENIKDLVCRQLIKLKYDNWDLREQKNTKIRKSGLTELDKIINGLSDGNLIIIAGRPSVGKTSLAVNIAYNVFSNQNTSLLIFSLEMSKHEVFSKIVSIGSKVDIENKKLNRLNNKEWTKLNNICNKLLSHNIYINDQNNVSISYIEKTTKSLKKKAVLI